MIILAYIEVEQVKNYFSRFVGQYQVHEIQHFSVFIVFSNNSQSLVLINREFRIVSVAFQQTMQFFNSFRQRIFTWKISPAAQEKLTNLLVCYKDKRNVYSTEVDLLKIFVIFLGMQQKLVRILDLSTILFNARLKSKREEYISYSRKSTVDRIQNVFFFCSRQMYFINH